MSDFPPGVPRHRASPGGGYRVYGVNALSVDGRKAETAGDTVMTPHASFLALPFAPREALNNIEVLANRFKAYGSHGFFDSVDVASGRVSDCELAIDQGMIMAAVANILVDGSIQKAFSDGKFAEVIRPLIAPEQFGSGIESRQARASSAPLEAPVRQVSRSPVTFDGKKFWNDLSTPLLLDSLKSYPTVRRFARDSFMAFFDPE